MERYDALAARYDELASDYDYKRYYDVVKDYIGANVVELGVGTAKFTTHYINKVQSVCLVDTSVNMLDKARAKLIKQRKKCNFVNDDMTAFAPIRKADTVIAICDAFNYAEDIGTLLRHIDSYLCGGGTMIFDISTQYKLDKIIGDNVFYEDGDNVTYIWTNQRKENYVDMDIVMFVRSIDGSYVRSDDGGRQYLHNTDRVKELLEAMCYSVRVLDGIDYRAVRPDSHRAVFIAAKA